MNMPTVDSQTPPLVTVVTACGGNPLLERCVASVAAQTWPRVQHLLMADGPGRHQMVRETLARAPTGLESGHRRELIELPYAVGVDRWAGHRIYGAGTFLGDGDYFAFLDDDNAYLPEHIADCMAVIESGRPWTYALRNIVDEQHRFICRDECESLGRWPSVLDEQDYMIDVNCYFLPRRLALQIAPLWFRRYREPGQMEIDRVICRALLSIAPEVDGTYRHTVNYRVGNSPLSVRPDFFIQGNARMLARYAGKLPWAREATDRPEQ
ncbi:glycosyltransferase family A protein [Variovorax dokdonensis]|uniref:Glycosyltransferase family A protein n=1 Tax=Variovorax dokdonensis TaxID=344883 RepID=A0ABT7NGT4_9BURK|nr:glycosyltransferase family A protein [Variovorax dokdonensis]MDM0047162.1 glycosyltransferase family A protein [Variovorax dokdonensis]